MYRRKRKVSGQRIHFNDPTAYGIVNAQEDREEIKEELDISEIVKVELLEEGCYTRRAHYKRNSADENIKCCVENEVTELIMPKNVQHKQADFRQNEHDRPDLIDISKIAEIKQETDGDNAEFSATEFLETDFDEKSSGKGGDDAEFSATEFLETDFDEKSSENNNAPSNKIFLKTDIILGVKSLKRPTKGPQHIAGSVETKNSQFKIKCEHCNEQFPTKFKFKFHLQKAHNIKEDFVLQCKYCPQKSKSTYSLKLHMLMCHLDELNLKTKWYKCSKCYLQSTDSEEIQIHKQESIWCQGAAVLLFHTCTECPFQTDRVAKLQGHIKWHYKFGTVRCPDCTFKCPPSHKKMMNEHLSLHKK